NGLMPLRALVAGLRTTVTFIRPATLQMPGPPLDRSAARMRPIVSKTETTCLRVNWVASAIVRKNSPLLRGFDAALILTTFGALFAAVLVDFLAMDSSEEVGFLPGFSGDSAVPSKARMAVQQ